MIPSSCLEYPTVILVWTKKKFFDGDFVGGIFCLCTPVQFSHTNFCLCTPVRFSHTNFCLCTPVRFSHTNFCLCTPVRFSHTNLHHPSFPLLFEIMCL